MSEKLCTLRTKGGGGGAKYTETSLWTNPSPTSDITELLATLSESVDNFKYIKIVWKPSKTATTTSDLIVPTDSLKSYVDTASGILGSLACNNSSTQPYARRFTLLSTTQIAFYKAFRLYAAAQDSTLAIPIEILGLNELDYGKRFDETTLWTNNAPTSAFANQTVALSDDIDNYDYITFRYRNSTSVATENEVVYKVSNFKQLILANNTIHNTAGLVRQDASNNTFCRPFGYVSNTSVKFEACYRLYNASYNQTDCIPTSIVGCKFI